MATKRPTLNEIKKRIPELTLDQKLKILSYLAVNRDMWNVISAMRGPDDNDYLLKLATTAIIRTVALGKDNVPLGMDYERGGNTVVDSSMIKDDHFGSHIREAVASLMRAGRVIHIGKIIEKSNDIKF